MLSPLIVDTSDITQMIPGGIVNYKQDSQSYLTPTHTTDQQHVSAPLLHHQEKNQAILPVSRNEMEDDEVEEERTLINPDILRDVIIGLSDGLTVPFGLTAGLSSLGSSKLVVVAGLAELISGAISMGIGGYLASEAERDQFRYLERKIRARVSRSTPEQMEHKVHEILGPIGARPHISTALTHDLMQIENRMMRSPDINFRHHGLWHRCVKLWSWKRDSYSRISSPDEEGATRERLPASTDQAGMTAFLLKFGEGQEEVPTIRLYISAFTIGISYFLGGLIPMAPYFVVDTARVALAWSIVVMTITLIIFGVLKAYFTGAQSGFLGYIKASCATIVVGGSAAAASYLVVAALENPNSSVIKNTNI